MVLGFLKKGRKAEAGPPEEPEDSPRQNGPLTVNEFIARCKKGKQKGLEPTKPELVAYARYLGIDPVGDGDLMWIAEEALHAPLPADWTEHHDSGDRVFYYNGATHISSWTHPLEYVHRETYKKILKFRNGSYSGAEKSHQIEAMRQECEEAERAAHRELHNWTEHHDDQGQKFYYCHEKKHSAWTDPRPAQCHVLYLQMKALRVLGASGVGNAGAVGSSSRLEPLVPLASDRSGGQSDRSQGGEKPSRSRKHDDAGGMPSDARLSETEEEPNSPAEDDRERRKRKKREKRERERDKGADGPSFPSPSAPPGSSRGAPAPDHSGMPSARGMRPSQVSPVEEVRSALGLGQGSLPPLGGGHHHGHNGLGAGGLPPLDTGGLSQVGRARVKAGIRLQPLDG